MVMDKTKQKEFLVGDVVVLKCGGPQMTIREISGRSAWCNWFTWTNFVGYTGNLNMDVFNVETLRML